MKRIFLSYRRQDTSGYAGRLWDKLTSHFGEESVFIDIDSIRPGDDFIDVLQRRIKASHAILVVIGKNWLIAKDDSGSPRLSNPEDFVRLEIAEALRRNILIVPLLVGGASMPRQEELPQDIAPLARRQAIEISDRRFHADVGQLIRVLEENTEIEKTKNDLAGDTGEFSKVSDEPASIFNVRMTYDLQRGAGIESKELPFVVGVLADLSGMPEEPLPRLRDLSRRFVNIDKNNFDEVMRGARPRLLLRVRNTTANDDSTLPVELKFERLDDFAPAGILKQVPLLKNFVSARMRLEKLHNVLDKKMQALLQSILQDPTTLAIVRKAAYSAELEPGDVVGALIEKGLPQVDGFEQEEIMRWIREFFSRLLDDDVKESSDVASLIETLTTRISETLSAQLDAILHRREIHSLEATWRGLHYLITQTETVEQLKIRVLNVSKDELRKDLEKAVEFDQSALFGKVFDEEYGTFGGEPYGVLIGDYYFGRHPRDIEFLEHLSNVAASAHAPFVAGVDSSMFGWNSLAEMKNHSGGLGRIFSGSHYLRWKSFRESEDARYVGLTLPRILLRASYSNGLVQENTFPFEEKVAKRSDYLWGNAAYAFAAILIEAFKGSRNPTKGKGPAVVKGLPTLKIAAEQGTEDNACAGEVAIDDDYKTELENLGFIPLWYRADAKLLVLDAMRSCAVQKVRPSKTSKLPDGADIEFPDLLTRCRLQHYLQVIRREKIGSFASRSDAEGYLNSWLHQYVKVDEGHVELNDVPGKPGLYTMTLSLMSHVQLWRKRLPGISEQGKQFWIPR